MEAQKQLKLLKSIAILEGISYLLFGVTMPLKYQLNMPLPNKIVGQAHGLLFIAYVLLVFLVSLKISYSKKELFLLYLASIVPFGTFIVEKKILSKSNGNKKTS
jgi:integral membrane protein